MAREWKPGDVAQYDGTCDGRMMRTVDGWRDTDGSHRRAPAESALRPLVVIDPEDEGGDLSRLWSLVPDHLVSIDQLQAALRDFANPTPPKPEEPTGLGAVVEDDEGFRWVRNESPSEPAWRSDARGWVHWPDLHAVRVLSEGVTA